MGITKGSILLGSSERIHITLRQKHYGHLAASVWNAGWIDHVDDRERYGAHERSLALSIEETRKAWARGRRLLPHSSAQVRESATGDSQEGEP